MAFIRKNKIWRLPDHEITPEAVFQNRREFLRLMGFSTTALAASFIVPRAWAKSGGEESARAEKTRVLPRLETNPAYPIRRPLTSERVAATYNNFYEFSPEKEGVWQAMGGFKTRPWQVRIGGLVNKPGVYDIDDLIRQMPMEERAYRLRCVEAWAMVVPWYGFPLRELMKTVAPKSGATYLKFTSFYQPGIAPGQKRYPRMPWPYTEGLSLDEAANELSLLAIGIYGHTLPGQHGGPVRLVVPWKYGYKSIKSVVAIEFTDTRPATFWNTALPDEYGYEANVDPDVPHPRWSQRREKMLGTGEIYATQKFNGYGDLTAYLYA
jgi:sulfoxide reductase catalytic subunit YedY